MEPLKLIEDSFLKRFRYIILLSKILYSFQDILESVP